jgi:hypothetical protein
MRFESIFHRFRKAAGEGICFNQITHYGTGRREGLLHKNNYGDVVDFISFWNLGLAVNKPF